MSRVLVIPPAESLIAELCNHLESSERDYSGSIVVFPGKRPAHFLRAAIAEREKKSFIPPRCFSIDAFVDELYGALTDVPSADLHAFDAAVMLHELHGKLSEGIGVGKFQSFDAFLPLGLKIFEEFEELAIACLPAKNVEAALLAVPLRGIHVLGALYRLFYEETAKRGYATRATRYATLAERFRPDLPGKFTRLLFAGFFGLTRAEARLLEKVTVLDNTTVIFQDGPGMRRQLEDLHLAAEWKKEGKRTHPEISCYSAPDTHGEIFGLATKLSESVNEGKEVDRHTVVVVPDPSAIPALVHHSLSVLPGEYNISIGYPHGRTPVLGFLTGLMDLVSTRHEGKLQAGEYLKFILHPYTKNVLFGNRADVTRILFHTVEDMFVNGLLPSFVTLEELEGCGELFERASARLGDRRVTTDKLAEHLRSIHDHTVRKMLTVGTIGNCAAACIEVLSFIAKRSTSRRHPFFRRYAESLVDSLAQIRRSMIAELSLPDAGAVFRVVRNCLLEGSVPLPGTPLRGVQVLGLLETRNLRFDTVYYINANDDLLPGPGQRYTLIPDGVRGTLGLPTRQEHDDVAEYYFQLLLAGSSQAHLFFTESDSKEASRFVEKILWRKAQETNNPDRRENIRRIRYDTRLTHAHPEEIPKPAGLRRALASMPFSASSLDTYLKCGLRFYYRYVLGLKEREDISGDIDRSGLGRFVHQVLAELYSPFVGKTMTGDDLGAQDVDGLIDHLFSEMFGEEQLGNQYLMKLQVRDQLTKYLRTYEVPRLNDAPAELLGVEKTLTVDHAGDRYVGRLDRIEKQNDKVAIYDYKTSGDRRKLRINIGELRVTERETWARAIGSLQLPVYSFLYRYAEHGDEAVILPSFLLLGRDDLKKEVELPLYEDETNREELYRSLEKIMNVLVSEIKDENLPFRPTTDLKENCPYCPFVSICGTKWVKKNYY